MLYDIFIWAQNFISSGAQFVNWLNDKFGFGNYTVLAFFTFSGLTFFIGTAIVKWFAS